MIIAILMIINTKRVYFMDIEEKQEIEHFLENHSHYERVFFISCIPFRQKQLKGDLAYSFLKKPNSKKDVRVIRVSSISMKLITAIKDIENLLGEFNCYVLNDLGELSKLAPVTLETSIVYQLPSKKRGESIIVAKNQNVNFFSNIRSFLLKSLILNSSKDIKNFSTLQFSKDCGVPQSTAQNFKKIGIETGHLRINKMGGLTLVDLLSTLEEWCFKQEQASIYYAQHLFNEDAESVVEEISQKNQKGKKKKKNIIIIIL